MDSIYHQSVIRLELSGELTLDLSDTVKNIAIKYDYENQVFPLFVIDLYVTHDEYEQLMNSNFDINLKIDYYDLSNNDVNETEEVTEPIILGNILTTTIKIYDKNMPKQNKYSSDDDETYDNSSDGARYMISLQGIPKYILEQNDNVINKVYNNASIDEILVDVMNEVITDVYIEPSTNTSRETTTIIPPSNLTNAIRFIDDSYGIYDSDMMMFFDTDCAYLLPIKPNERTYEENRIEVSIKYQHDVSDNEEYVHNYMNDNVIYKTIPSLSIISIEDSNNNLTGGKCYVSSHDSDYELVVRNYNLNNDSKIRYFWNFGIDNNWEKKAFNILNKRSFLNFNNINPSLFNPLSNLVIINEDGVNSFSITEKVVTFNTDDYKNYIIRTSLTISR